MRRVLLVILFVLVGFTPALAEVLIEGSSGGEIGSFLDFFSVLRHSGERVVIDGPCYSACTLVLSTIPRDRICVTRRAVLGFHAARLVDQDGGEYPGRPRNAFYGRDLSLADPQVDQAPWRPDAHPDLSQWT